MGEAAGTLSPGEAANGRRTNTISTPLSPGPSLVLGHSCPLMKHATGTPRGSPNVPSAPDCPCPPSTTPPHVGPVPTHVHCSPLPLSLHSTHSQVCRSCPASQSRGFWMDMPPAPRRLTQRWTPASPGSSLSPSPLPNGPLPTHYPPVCSLTTSPACPPCSPVPHAASAWISVSC